VKKNLARALFVAGAVAIGLFLSRSAPRDVTLVYGLGGTRATSLEVVIERNGEAVRRTAFRFPGGTPPQASHEVRLPEGRYLLRLTITADGSTRHLERPVTVEESGAIVVPLGS